MCLFCNSNSNTKSKAYAYGVTQFKCGACPECMRERASKWALRAVYESKSHIHNCMITLTYDHFSYDDNGNVIGEMPVDPDLHVNKRHVQLFIKRLRKKFGNGVKYILCAEYGSRTHRAHYHALLFGVDFHQDRVPYKKSKRGNQIYSSHTLTTLWGHGICTVDCVNVGTAVARYCTKYCAKTRSEDTFMLFSQKIGYEKLISDFNGISYWIEGQEYSVPKFVWQWYITDKYKNFQLPFSYRYVNRDFSVDPSEDFRYIEATRLRDTYSMIRDRDPVYCEYISYWRKKARAYEKSRPPVLQRIYSLDRGKYSRYIESALDVYQRRTFKFIPEVAPGSKSVSAFNRWLLCGRGDKFERWKYFQARIGHLLRNSRLFTTSDTISSDLWNSCWKEVQFMGEKCFIYCPPKHKIVSKPHKWSFRQLKWLISRNSS